jgi:ubiquinol-cytochrome c reductase cytochrome b subunit
VAPLVPARRISPAGRWGRRRPRRQGLRATYRPIYRQFFWIFVIVGIGLGYLGAQPAEGGYVIAARILTAYYFIHFLIILPIIGLIERPKPLPSSISEAVLAKSGEAAVEAKG